MKSLLFFALLCTCVPAFSYAGTDAAEPLITRSSVEGDRLTLTLANLQELRTEVEITSLDGDTAYFRKVIKQHNGYRVALQLSDLPNGRYVVTVSQGETVRKQVILKRDTHMLASDWQ